MTTLRQQMIHDLQLRGLGERTQTTMLYLHLTSQGQEQARAVIDKLME